MIARRLGSPLHRSLTRLLLALTLLGVASDAQAGRWRFQSPALPGAYAVGLAVFDVDDPARDDRCFGVHVWYPCDPESTEGEPSFYPILLGAKPR